MLAGVSLIIAARMTTPINPRLAYTLGVAASDEIVAGGQQFITGGRMPSPLESAAQSLGIDPVAAHQFVTSFKMAAAVGPLMYATALRLQQIARTLTSELEIAAAESGPELMANRGQAIGVPGRSPGVRTVGSEAELKSWFAKLCQGGKAVNNSYPGEFVELPDGTTVGLRNVSDSGGPTIDVVPADGAPFKVHINPWPPKP
jgi:hypothetical protein